jgi:hypothetical protein
VTVLIAILLALGVPFAQLHTVNDHVTCCCPSPDVCKCPDHEPDDGGQPMMKVCHKQAPKTVRAQLATFVAPAAIELVVPVPRVERVAHARPSPHAPPDPHWPAAPS